MIFNKDKKKKEKPEMCVICKVRPAVTKIRDFSGSGVVWVCKECKKNVRI